MKKASKILLTIGGVFHIVEGVGFISAAITFIVGSILFFGFGNNWFGAMFDTMEEGTEAAQIALTVSGCMYIFGAFLFIGFAILSFIGAKLTFNIIDDGEKKDFIISIVFAALLDNTPALVGSIFKFFVKKEPKQMDSEEASEVVE